MDSAEKRGYVIDFWCRLVAGFDGHGVRGRAKIAGAAASYIIMMTSATTPNRT